MSLSTVALLSPGDMGHAVGAVLVANGLEVITCLEGRSERTKSLATKAGIAAVGTYAELVHRAQMIISIMVPAEVEKAAAQVADTLRETGAEIVYVDCNAVAPETAKRVAATIAAAGSRAAMAAAAAATSSSDADGDRPPMSITRLANGRPRNVSVLAQTCALTDRG